MTGWYGWWWSRTCWCPSRSPPRISCWWGHNPEPWLLLCTLQGSVSASNHHPSLKNTHTHTFMHFISFGVLRVQFKLTRLNFETLKYCEMCIYLYPHCITVCDWLIKFNGQNSKDQIFLQYLSQLGFPCNKNQLWCGCRFHNDDKKLWIVKDWMAARIFLLCFCSSLEKTKYNAKSRLC